MIDTSMTMRQHVGMYQNIAKFALNKNSKVNIFKVKNVEKCCKILVINNKLISQLKVNI